MPARTASGKKRRKGSFAKSAVVILEREKARRLAVIRAVDITDVNIFVSKNVLGGEECGSPFFGIEHARIVFGEAEFLPIKKCAVADKMRADKN